jgi:hypothetical protein
MRFGTKQISMGFVVGAFLLAAGGAHAQSMMETYGAREAVECPTDAAGDAAPTNEQASALVKCTIEGIGDGRLYLIDDPMVTVGEPRAFNPQLDIYYEEIQEGSTMYPITGSLVRWECEAITDRNRGANCRSGIEATARGVCYKTTNGAFACTMSGNAELTEGIPGPQS